MPSDHTNHWAMCRPINMTRNNREFPLSSGTNIGPFTLLLQVDANDLEGVGGLAVEEQILVSGEHVDLLCAHDS